MKLEKIKRLIISNLVEEGYELGEATQDVEEATISQRNKNIEIVYINGVVNYYKIVKALKFIK